MIMQKDRIICLVGASGSGKTTLAKELEGEGYNIIKSYTTREPRGESEWGHTFITDWSPVILSDAFVGIENRENPDEIPCKYKYIDIDNMIAYFENYNAIYFATKEQYQGKGTSIYVVDPNGAEEVHRNVKDAEVITVYLMVDREERRWRMIGQGRNMDDIYDRLDKDDEIFNNCKCDYVIDANWGIEETLDIILEIIK